jgi:hypothetical protein
MGQIEVLHKLWEWAKDILTPEELRNKLFLDKDFCGRTVWHISAEKGRLDLLHKLCGWAKALLTQEELSSMLFLAKDINEWTAWH